MNAKAITPIPRTNDVAIIPIDNILIFLSPSCLHGFFMSDQTGGQRKKKPVANTGHGFAKFLLLRQPGYLLARRPVAFRPRLTTGLALSALYYEVWLSI
jgi:hypothetical protein